MPESLASMRRLISHHCMVVFKERKEELMNERIECYKKNDWQGYSKKIGQAAQEYQ